MTTLDQIRLLETKVENAVAKMQQFQAENDALRNKCAELTNALESKTEQLLAFTTNKEEIEEGIKNALDRLNFIENSVLSSGSPVSNGQGSIHITPGAGLSSIEPIANEVNQNNETVSHNSFSSGNEQVSAPSTESFGSEEIASPSYTETPVSNPSEKENVVDNVEYKTEKTFAEQSSGPNFNTMDMAHQQPETITTENPENKNNIDDGDQDAFEYDIF